MAKICNGNRACGGVDKKRGADRPLRHFDTCSRAPTTLTTTKLYAVLKFENPAIIVFRMGTCAASEEV
eukprot:6176774-Pleurochrysis_carterae.AAC.4